MGWKIRARGEEKYGLNNHETARVLGITPSVISKINGG